MMMSVARVCLLLISGPGCLGIILNQIKIPLHPQVNNTATLVCEYDLRGEPLYSVKWYKDNTEFYRYLPRDDPPSLAFPVPGTQVLKSLSDHTTVYLANLSLESSGRYQCEVSTEAPKFKTVAADGVMKVVQPPGAGPALSWLNIGDKLRQRLGAGGHYGARVGERLRIGCMSGESFPASSLKFYINDEIANDKNVRQGRSHFADNRGDLKSSSKDLDIILERRHFRYGDLTIKCTSELYNIYFQSSKMIFVGLDLGEMALGRQTINSGENNSISWTQLCVLFYIVYVTNYN